MSPPTVSLTLYGSDFSGRKSHTKLAYVNLRPVGTSYFMIHYIVLVACTWLSIPLESIPGSFPTAFHQVSLSFTNNKVSAAFFPPLLIVDAERMWLVEEMVGEKVLICLGAEILSEVAQGAA